MTDQLPKYTPVIFRACKETRECYAVFVSHSAGHYGDLLGMEAYSINEGWTHVSENWYTFGSTEPAAKSVDELRPIVEAFGFFRLKEFKRRSKVHAEMLERDIARLTETSPSVAKLIK